MSDTIATTNVNGYQVRTDFGDEEPRIHDIELARRLGYERPRKIRELISRHVDAGHLGAPGVCPTMGQTSGRGGRPATEYWLDEASALFVASQSGTAKSIAITKEVISVFVAFRRGHVTKARSVLLADTMVEWDEMFGPTLVDAMSRLYGHRYTGRMPRFLASVFARIYRLIVESECYEEMKERNPSPHKGKNHHQLLTPQARERFKLHLGIVEFTARAAVTKDDFWQRLESAYRSRPMQLPLTHAA